MLRTLLIRTLLIFAVAVVVLTCPRLQAQAKQEPARTAATQELGNGFYDHGVATPISNHRGTVATVDGDGRNVAMQS